MNITSLKKDFFASIIVFLVALPLAIGLSIACGLPIYCGLISGIIGGIVVGALSGGSFQVSGPAAGLILIVADIITNMGTQALFLTIFIAGLIQIAFGLLQLGNYFRAISPAIIQGMLSGIGISIFLSQFHIMLDSTPLSNFWANLSTLWDVIYNSIVPIDWSTHQQACIIGIWTISCIVLWKSLRTPKLKIIPSALVAVLSASLIANIFHFDINYIKMDSNFLSGITFLNFSQIPQIFNTKILIMALVITFIASAETLLTSTAIDKMEPRSKTNYNKEIIAQGVGNSIVGIIGGLPITGVIVRSVANINANAQTRLSPILHGFWILLFVVCLPQVLNYIPTASLAGILVYTGFTLIDVKAAKYLYSLSKGEFIIYIITLFAILFTNLFEGILIGFACAFIKNAYKVLKTNIHKHYLKTQNKMVICLRGNITFLQLPSLINIFESIPNNTNVDICVDKLYFIDHACADYIKDWEQQHKTQNNGNNIINIDWNGIKHTYPKFQWHQFHKHSGFNH